MNRAEARNDIHRKSVFQPEFYTFVGWYTLRALARKGSKAAILKSSVEAWEGSEEAQDFKAMQWGDWGQCVVCGARYVMGEVWKHKETMDHIHVGWECALKYREIVAAGVNWVAIKKDRDAWLEGERTKVKAEKFVAMHPGLAEALDVDHDISRDLKFKLGKYGDLSDRQVALAFRLRDQVAADAAKRAAWQSERDAEAKVAAPTGRVSIRGVVLSIKEHSSAYGDCLKMTVKVKTADGMWLAWGTIPGSIAADVRKGDEVAFDGEVEAGREPHFAFFKRPTKASIVGKAAAI